MGLYRLRNGKSTHILVLNLNLNSCQMSLEIFAGVIIVAVGGYGLRMTGMDEKEGQPKRPHWREPHDEAKSF
jgi:hypothetical protein